MADVQSRRSASIKNIGDFTLPLNICGWTDHFKEKEAKHFVDRINTIQVNSQVQVFLTLHLALGAGPFTNIR